MSVETRGTSNRVINAPIFPFGRSIATLKTSEVSGNPRLFKFGSSVARLHSPESPSLPIRRVPDMITAHKIDTNTNHLSNVQKPEFVQKSLGFQAYGSAVARGEQPKPSFLYGKTDAMVPINKFAFGQTEGKKGDTKASIPDILPANATGQKDKMALTTQLQNTKDSQQHKISSIQRELKQLQSEPKTGFQNNNDSLGMTQSRGEALPTHAKTASEQREITAVHEQLQAVTKEVAQTSPLAIIRETIQPSAKSANNLAKLAERVSKLKQQTKEKVGDGQQETETIGKPTKKSKLAAIAQRIRVKRPLTYTIDIPTMIHRRVHMQNAVEIAIRKQLKAGKTEINGSLIMPYLADSTQLPVNLMSQLRKFMQIFLRMDGSYSLSKLAIARMGTVSLNQANSMIDSINNQNPVVRLTRSLNAPKVSDEQVKVVQSNIPAEHAA